MELPVRTKWAICIWIATVIILFFITVLSYWNYNQVIEDELIDTMAARTGESANHINTYFRGQLGEVQETVHSPVLDEVLHDNPNLELTEGSPAISLIDQLNAARWNYVSTAYPNQYVALHIINYLGPNEWGNEQRLSHLMARYYNAEEGICKTDPWAKSAAEEAGLRYAASGEAYDAIFKPAYSQAYGRDMVLMIAWKRNSLGKIVAGAAASLSIETIQNIAQQASFGSKGYEILLAHDGTFISHPNPNWVGRQTIQDVSDDNMNQLGTAIKTNQSGIFQYNDQGTPKIAFYNPIPIAGWTLVSVIDAKELFMPANKLMIHVLMLIVIIVIFTSMVAYIVFLILNLRRSNMDRNELRVRNDELSVTKERLRQQNIELEEAKNYLINMDHMKSEFLMRVSHELKTPLHGIIGLAECTRDDLAGQSGNHQEENLNMIVHSGVRLANLVDEFADFSALRNDTVQLIRSPVNLCQVVQMVLTLETFIARSRSILLENMVSADLPLVYVDSERVMQILHNLIYYAIKYTENGSVTVSANVQTGGIVVTITDTGISISAQELNILFDSLDKKNISQDTHYGQLGLGLSITKKLLELHDSELIVSSMKGKGVCFSFSLPLWDGQKNELTRSSEPVNERMFHFVEGSSISWSLADIMQPEISKKYPNAKRILAVDDEVVNLAVIKNCFRGLPYDVTFVQSGEEALQKIEQNEYHLVLLDIMMAGMNGLEVCSKIRDKHPENVLPIIMVTVRNRPEDVELAFMTKANDYLSKPFHKKELLARVQAQLRLQEMNDTERRMHKAELSALQAQIEPHFLYNTLNSIIVLCRKDSGKAAELLENLSDYLQNKYRFNSMELIPLIQEIDLIRTYLAIEQVRFGKRLQFHISITTKRNPFIPPMILQPLVENAIKHGIYPKREGGCIDISVKESKGMLILFVRDDGVGMTQEKVKSVLSPRHEPDSGIGLQNINQRVIKQYNREIDIQSTLNKGTTISIRLPLS